MSETTPMRTPAAPVDEAERHRTRSPPGPVMPGRHRRMRRRLQFHRHAHAGPAGMAPGRRGGGRSEGTMTQSHADPDATIESIGEFGLIDRLARIVAGSQRDP